MDATTPTPNESSHFTTNTNSLNNLNSIKSKQFQMHTRKLIEIALEMLAKSQVPSVQYIALTTINRIFDIYVYHNLFYPGYYESCYIPLSKRKMIKQKQMQLELERNQNLKLEQDNKVTDAMQIETSVANDLIHSDVLKPKKKSYFFNNKRMNSNGNSNTNKKYCTCNYTKTELESINFNELNVCNSASVNRFSYKLNFEMKDKNSTIKEDPSSVDDLNSLKQSSNPINTDKSPISGYLMFHYLSSYLYLI
jgi:hypothetical protein